MGSALLVAGLLLLLGPASLGDGGGAAPERHQYCVVGAGPAGLQLGFFLQQAQRDYVILERASGPGAFFRKYPVHRQLISINKRYTGHELDEPRRSAEFNLRHDWNSLVNDQAVGGKSLLFTNYSERYLPPADDLVTYLEDFAALYGLQVRYNEEVSEVHRPPANDQATQNHPSYQLSLRTVGAADKAYECGVVVVATGISTPNIPAFKGIEHLQRYDDMSVDPKDFVGQSIMVIGNGNSAFETASNLLEVANYVHIAGRSAARLTIATHYVGDVRM